MQAEEAAAANSNAVKTSPSQKLQRRCAPHVAAEHRACPRNERKATELATTKAGSNPPLPFRLQMPKVSAHRIPANLAASNGQPLGRVVERAPFHSAQKLA